MRNSILILALIICSTAFAKTKFESPFDSTFNGQLFIQKGDTVIYNLNNGYADFKTKTKISDSTLFELGRVTETFTYHFIEHLASIGQIKVSDKIAKYMPTFPYKDISIQHLLNHQSGLPKNVVRFYYKNHYSNQTYKLIDRAKRFDNHDIKSIIERVKPKLLFTPGEKMAYSEMDYIFLNLLIERITFTPTQQFVQRFFKHQDFVFAPLANAETDSIVGKAQGYSENGSQKVPYDNMHHIEMPFQDGTIGNKHFFLAAKDLVLWSNYITKDVDFSFIKSKEDGYFIKGFFFNKKMNALIAKGEFCGTSSYLVILPNKGITFCYQSNVVGPQNADQIIEKIIVGLK